MVIFLERGWVVIFEVFLQEPRSRRRKYPVNGPYSFLMSLRENWWFTRDIMSMTSPGAAGGPHAVSGTEQDSPRMVLEEGRSRES